MTDRSEVRAFGAWAFLLADGLFFGSLLFAYAYMRGRLLEYPDAPAQAIAEPLLPLLHVACLAAAAALHRWTRSLVAVFLALALALALLAAFWQASADQGLTPRVGRYGAIVYLATLLLALHAAGAMVAAGLHLIRGRRDAREAPLLGRFVTFLACVAAVVSGAVILW